MVFRGTRSPSSPIPPPTGEAEGRGKRGASRIVPVFVPVLFVGLVILVCFLALR
jgi:hypothetical protein